MFCYLLLPRSAPPVAALKSRTIMDRLTSNLLDEAIGFDDPTKPSPLIGRLLLVEDCVETSGAFVLHHLLKRAFSSRHSSNAVIFIAFSQSFVHYDRVIRKLVRSRYFCMSRIFIGYIFSYLLWLGLATELFRLWYEFLSLI